MVANLLKDAGLDGYFTNHSLRRTAATRLFCAGQNVKLIKKVTGHVSDAVEKYEMTSDEQRMAISSIIQGESPTEVTKQNSECNQVEKCDKVEEVVANVNENTPQNVIQNAIEAAVRATGNRRATLTITINLLE